MLARLYGPPIPDFKIDFTEICCRRVENYLYFACNCIVVHCVRNPHLRPMLDDRVHCGQKGTVLSAPYVHEGSSVAHALLLFYENSEDLQTLLKFI
jgi:hypothetical protein